MRAQAPGSIEPMNDRDEWLREARACLESAQAAHDSRIKDAWIELAVEWMKLLSAAPEIVAARVPPVGAKSN